MGEGAAARRAAARRAPAAGLARGRRLGERPRAGPVGAAETPQGVARQVPGARARRFGEPLARGGCSETHVVAFCFVLRSMNYTFYTYCYTFRILVIEIWLCVCTHTTKFQLPRS